MHYAASRIRSFNESYYRIFVERNVSVKKKGHILLMII